MCIYLYTYRKVSVGGHGRRGALWFPVPCSSHGRLLNFPSERLGFLHPPKKSSNPTS